MAEEENDIEAYLKRIRESVAQGEELVRQAELRMAETDRMLESQGLTREQVLAMKFTDEQIAAVNKELNRRGLESVNFDDSLSSDYGNRLEDDSDVDTSGRHRKLRRLMRQVRL